MSAKMRNLIKAFWPVLLSIGFDVLLSFVVNITALTVVLWTAVIVAMCIVALRKFTALQRLDTAIDILKSLRRDELISALKDDDCDHLLIWKRGPR